MTDLDKRVEKATLVFHKWPERASRVSEIENALSHWIGWDDIARMRSDFDSPEEVLGIPEQELKGRLYKQDDTYNEIRKIIQEWSNDPDGYRNPYAKFAPQMQKK